MKDTDYRVIPKSIRADYTELEHQITWIYERWIMYQQLYGTNQRRIDLLNETVPDFFAELERFWREYVILHICRIATDNTTVCGKETLVIRQLRKKLDTVKYPKLAKSLDKAWKKVARATKVLHDIRNNMIAHVNHKAIFDGRRRRRKVTRKMIQDALEAVAEYANIVRETFLGSPMYYAGLVMYVDAETLLYCLKQSHEYRKLEQEDPQTYVTRIKQGDFRDV
jgi:hypothetical protein